MNDKKHSGSKIAGKNVKNTPAIPVDKMIEEIGKRANEIYRERGNAPGSDMDDWLKAEREIKAKYHLS